MPGFWSSIPSICSSVRAVAYARCRSWADAGYARCTRWADEGSSQCSSWADRGSNQCASWADHGRNECSSWADHGHNECCDWAPCSWFCDAFYWVANWVCQGWYWVSQWVCQAWYWVANWVCQAWYWVAKWVCKASYWVAQWICLAWEWVTHLFCSGNAGPVFLLTDGTVLLNENASGYGTRRWWKLEPDAAGTYTGGTWTRVADSNVGRKYFASAVLADGRLVVCGGEYSDASGSNQQDESTTAEIYDPVADAWTVLASPPGSTQIGDAPCCVLPDGRLLLGEIDNRNTFFFDPATDTWTAGPTKGTAPSEESWVLMPDGTVVTPQTASIPNAEKYDAATNTWVSAGVLPGNIVEASSFEIGPGVLLPDGRAFFVGANAGNTALYTPGATAAAAGSWSAGPTIPNRPRDTRAQGSKDGPAALLPGGSVLFAVAPVDGVRGNYLSPCTFYECDGTTLTRVTDPPNADCATYFGRLLPLPTGEILWAREDHSDMYVYVSAAQPQNAWRPVITGSPATIVPGSTFTLSGQQLNGLSQAQGYGDDYAAATNYPLVRIINLASGHVRYCDTFGHSTMAVATGAATVTTTVDVPADLELGASELEVVANGIASERVGVRVTRKRRDALENQGDQESALVGS